MDGFEISVQKRETPPAADDSGTKPEKPFNIRAIDRALSVLLSFRSSDPGLSLTEVARRTGLDKGTARRILLTLAYHKFVSHEPTRKKYLLGPAITQLAAAVTQNYDFRDIVRPVLKSLGDHAGACVNFAVRRDLDAVNIERYEPRSAFIMKSHWQIGSKLPLNIGAAPRILMAAMPDQEIDALLADRDKQKSLAQPVDPSSIRAHIERIRKDGWAVSVDEYALGVSTIGAPVKGTNGNTMAAISIIGLTPQLVKDGKFVHLPDLLAAAEGLSGNDVITASLNAAGDPGDAIRAE